MTKLEEIAQAICDAGNPYFARRSIDKTKHQVIDRRILDQDLDDGSEVITTTLTQVGSEEFAKWLNKVTAARAAVEAMRKPTVAMDEAPSKLGRIVIGSFTAAEVWRAMIDAILNEEQGQCT